MTLKNISFKKILRNLKTFFSNPANIILVVFAVILSVMVIYPLITLFFDAFTIHSISEAKEINEVMETTLKKGDLTIGHWALLLFNTDVEGFSEINFWELECASL